MSAQAVEKIEENDATQAARNAASTQAMLNVMARLRDPQRAAQP